MIALTADLAGLPAVHVPAAADLAEDVTTWADRVTEALLGEDADGESRALAVAQLVNATTNPPGLTTASIALVDYAQTVVGVLRLALDRTPLDSTGEQQVFGGDDPLVARIHQIATDDLGSGVSAYVVVQDDNGIQRSWGRWMFNHPGGVVLGTVGPLPSKAIGALAPSAEAVLNVITVQGLDVDGVPFNQQPSLTAVPELTGDSVWES